MFFTSDDSNLTVAQPAAPPALQSFNGYWGDQLVANDEFKVLLNGLEIDLEAKVIGGVNAVCSYDTAYAGGFQENTKHYSGSYGPNDTLEIRINNITRFYGWIIDEPRKGASGDHVSYQAFGTRYRANEVMVVNEFGVPRVVFNPEPEDEDYDSDMADMTCGEIIKWLFNEHSVELLAKGLSASYDGADLDAMTAKPGRIGMADQTFDRALLTVLASQPGFKMRVNPHTRVWHFDETASLASRTITYNSDSVGTPNLTRTIRNCATAVKIVGDEQIVDDELLHSLAELEEYWTAGLEADWTRDKCYAEGNEATYGYVGRRYRIVDPTRRRMSKTLSDGTCARVYKKYKGGGTTWIPVAAKFSWNEGIFLTDEPLLGVNADPTTEGGFEPAADVKLIYAYKTTPLTARKPAASYEGTAYTVLGYEYERTIHVPEFRLASQQSDFEDFAQSVLDGLKDIAWSGDLLLLGTQAWDWFFLGRTINIASQNEVGAPVVTGMEAIAALMTELRINRDANTSSINFTSDPARLGSSSYQQLLNEMLARQKLQDTANRAKEINRALKLAECQHPLSPTAWGNGDLTRKKLAVYNDYPGAVAVGQAVVPTGEVIEVSGVEYEKVTQPTEDGQQPAYLSAEGAAAQGVIFDVWAPGASIWLTTSDWAEMIPGDNLGTMAVSFSVRRDHQGIGVVVARKEDAIKVLMGKVTDLIGVRNDYDGAVSAGSIVQVTRMETNAEEADDNFKRTVVDRPSAANIEAANLLIMHKPFTAKGRIQLAWRMTGTHLVRVEREWNVPPAAITYIMGEGITTKKDSFLGLFADSPVDGFGVVANPKIIVDIHAQGAIAVRLTQQPRFVAYVNDTGAAVDPGDVLKPKFKWNATHKVNEGDYNAYGRFKVGIPTIDSDPNAVVAVTAAADGDEILCAKVGIVQVDTSDDLSIGQEIGTKKDSKDGHAGFSKLGKVTSLIGGVKIQMLDEET